MKLRAWRLLALSSALFATLICAATRPRYGGTLRLQIPEPMPSLSHLVFETLVRLDERGDPKLHLASGWQHDADFRRWQIYLRAGVSFHDGIPLNGADAQSSLAKALPNATVTAEEHLLVIQSEAPRPNLLRELAAPRTAIVRSTEDGVLIGTGPFQLKDSTLLANEAHWQGRPFLDSITISTSGAADVMQLPVGATQRMVPERFAIWTSAPRELFVIQSLDAPPVIRQALSASIDRAAIANVLTLGRGLPTGALLPQWMSGYAFLFTSPADLQHARQLLVGVRLMPLTLSYSSADPLAKSIVGRIAVNARDAGLSIQISPLAPNPNLRLARIRIESLARIAEEFGLVAPSGSLYERERAMLEGDRVMPLLHVPDVFAIHARVRGWETAHENRDGLLHLDNIWIEP
jgi:hypothetical protein